MLGGTGFPPAAVLCVVEGVTVGAGAVDMSSSLPE